MENEVAEDVAQTSTTPEDAQSSPVENTEVETDENTGATSEPEGAEPDSEPRKSRAQDRIEQLVAEQKALREAAEYWRTQAVKPVEPEQPKEDPRPTRAQFEYDDDKYDAALADWTSRQIEKGVQEQVSKSLEQQRTQSEQAKRDAKWQSQVTEFESKHSDFRQVALNPTLRITKEMVEVMQDSDKGPDILYHLGKNPDKAARIAGMSPYQQAMAIGRLEAEVSAPKRPQPSRAPAPPNPVSSEASPSVDPSQMSIDEWMKWRSRELRSKRS